MRGSNRASLSPASMYVGAPASIARGLFCIRRAMPRRAHTPCQTPESGLDRELLASCTLHAGYQTHPNVAGKYPVLPEHLSLGAPVQARPLGLRSMGAQERCQTFLQENPPRVHKLHVGTPATAAPRCHSI